VFVHFNQRQSYGIFTDMFTTTNASHECERTVCEKNSTAHWPKHSERHSDATVRSPLRANTSERVNTQLAKRAHTAA